MEEIPKKNFESHVLSKNREDSKKSIMENLRECFSRFFKNIKREQEIINNVPKERISEVEEEATNIEVSSDVAREMLSQSIPIEHKDTSRALEKGESIAEKGNPFEFLTTVRMTDHLPKIKDGKLFIETPMAATRGDVARPTLHFALNEKVGSHAQGDVWESSSYAICAPMDAMVTANGLPYGFGKLDTYWLVDEGVALPDGTNIFFRKDTEKDSRLQSLKEICKEQGMKINFVESDDLSDDTINEGIKKMGYGYYGAEDDDQKIRERFHIETGGYGAHYNSWLHGFERTFMHGNPELTSGVISKEYLAARTPADQFYQLKINVDSLPEKLYAQYESLAARRLEFLLDHADASQEFFRAHLKSLKVPEKEQTPQAVAIEDSKMLGQVMAYIFDGSEFGKNILNHRPQLTKKIIQAIIERIGKKAYAGEEAGANLSNEVTKSLDNFPEKSREEFFEKFAAVGGPEGIAFLFKKADALDDVRKHKIVEGIMAHPEAFGERMSEENLRYFINDLKNEESAKTYESLGFSGEFITMLIKKYGEGK